jgi:4-hydroxybenzoate polyprenyltransferase
MTRARAILITLRPHQWVKNSFVLAALVFSKHLFDPAFALRTLAAVLAFCALSGAVYAFNDVRDAEQDRQHPRKRHRPIAAGHLSERTALWVTALLTIGALAGCLALSWQLAVTGALYFAINLSYSLWLKRIAYLDVGLITAGFLLRVVAGGYAIDVPISHWLLSCTGLLAAMLGFGKRAHELALAERLERDPVDTRASLGGYHGPSLSWLMIVLAISACVGYALYTRDPHTVDAFGSRWLIVTLPFCVLGIARFLQLTLMSRSDDSPTDAMLRDMPFLANLALWGVAVLFIIYGSW